MAKSKVYYTLAVLEDGKWAPQFGAYQKRVVMEERDDQYAGGHGVPLKNLKIITSGEKQSEIDAVIAKLNKAMA